MRDIPKSPRIVEINKKKRRKVIKTAVYFLLLFVFVVVGLSFLSKEKHIVIKDIKVNGAYVLDQDSIERTVRDEMSGKYLYLFYKNNSFIYPEKKIYNSLLRNFPRIESLSISLNGLKELVVDIVERRGEALYCGENIPTEQALIGENCFFLNDDGLIFDGAPYFSGDIYFKYYLSFNESSDPLGKQLMGKERFHELAYFFNNMRSIGLTPVYFFMDKDGTNYLYLNKKTNTINPKIIFKDNDNLDVLSDNLSLAMKKKEFSEELSSKYSSLEYIDLRFKNKILYRFK